jgi:hypothetical protein
MAAIQTRDLRALGFAVSVSGEQGIDVDRARGVLPSGVPDPEG